MSKKSPFCWLFCSFLEPLPSLIFELTSSLTHRAAALAPSAAISCSVIPSFLLHPLSILTSQTFSVMIRIPYMVVTQLCPTLCDPMDCIACQATLSMGFSRQYWSGLSFPSVNQTSSGGPHQVCHIGGGCTTGSNRPVGAELQNSREFIIICSPASW